MPKKLGELLDSVPPNDSETEMRVVGSCFLDGGKVDEVRGIVGEGDFYEARLRTVWRHLLAMRDRGDGIGLDLVWAQLLAAGDAKDGLDLDFLAAIQATAPTAAHAVHYSKIVRDLSVKRRAITDATEVIRMAYSGATPADVHAEVEAMQRRLARCHGCRLTPFSDIEPTPIDWLWPNRIPIGMITTLAGDPGVGKSLVSLDIAGRVSTGYRWPDIAPPAPPGDTILLSAEDPPKEVIRPRLDATGADVARVHQPEITSLQSGLGELDAAVRAVANPRLVVIDPVSAYLGQIDSWKDSEVRGTLAPLAELAERRQVAILLITHLTKAPATSSRPALYRAMGSIAFVAASRAAWAITKDKDNPSVRLMLPLKCNLAADVSGLSYQIVTEGDQPMLAWGTKPVTVDVNEAMAAGHSDGGVEKQSAKDWLKEALKDGPVASRDLKRWASECGHSWRTVERAKAELGIQAYKERYSDGTWHYRLPESASEHRHL